MIRHFFDEFCQLRKSWNCTVAFNEKDKRINKITRQGEKPGKGEGMRNSVAHRTKFVAPSYKLATWTSLLVSVLFSCMILSIDKGVKKKLWIWSHM